MGDDTLPANITIQLVPPIVGKSDLVSWWWFDEGKGRNVTDSIGGGVGELMGSTSWSVDSSYGNSLSFQNVGDHADLKIPVSEWDSNLCSIGFWFNRKQESFSWSSEQISNVMFSLGNEENSSIQIGTNGSGVEVFLNSFGKRTRTSLSGSVKNDTWHYLSLTYDSGNEKELKIYLDGKLIGSSSIFAGSIDAGNTEKWLLGLAQLSNPSQGRFIGNIDDLRIFDQAITLQDHQRIYNRGYGDLNLVVQADYLNSTDINPIILDLNFSRYGMPCEVDFNSSLFISGLQNAVVHSGLVDTNGSDFRIELNASKNGVILDPKFTPGIVQINLPKGVGVDSSGAESLPLSLSIGFGRPVVRLENLTAWWNFDENNGSTVSDYMNGFVGTFVNHLDGNVTFSTSEKKFGVSALHFPRNAWVRTNAFASELGIGGNSPRTISFWMKALDNGKSNHNNWETGVYGIGQRRDFKMWAIRSLWNTANYRYFRTQHWRWDQNVFVSEGVRDKWMHIAHLYDSKNVMVYVNGTRRANLSKDDLNTGDTFPLLLGQWTDENRKDRTFHGYLDDFRVYNASLNFSEIQRIYNDGNGDFKIIPVFDLDPVVETSPAIGNVKFFRNGEPVNVQNFSSDDLTITNGQIIDFNQTNEIGNYIFSFSLDSENIVSNINLLSGKVEDSYDQTNDFASIATRRMYRSVIHGKDLIAWWPFDDDKIGDNIVASKTGSIWVQLSTMQISLLMVDSDRDYIFIKINQMPE